MATTVSTGDPKRKGQNDLDVTLSKKELEEQKMELLEKLKAAAKAPEQAERWVRLIIPPSSGVIVNTPPPD